jgi:hypothetical protein
MIKFYRMRKCTGCAAIQDALEELCIAHLEELEQFKELWYKFQSDACYCDE